MSQVAISMFCTAYSIDIVTLARKAEALGFAALWLPEHPIIPVEMQTPFPGNPEGVLPEHYKHTLDPFVALAAAAGATERIRLGTAICLVPERNPLHTAKEVASLDQVSGGRFDFGVGAGWLREESELMGCDFPRRWSQTREHVLAMQACWRDDVSEFHGKFVDFPKVWSHPKPIQQPNPPVHIAGELAKAASRVAEYGDGWLPRAREIDPAGVEKGRRKIEDLYTERGRSTANLTVNLFGAKADKPTNRAFFDAGVNQVIHLLPTDNEANTTVLLEKMAAELL